MLEYNRVGNYISITKELKSFTVILAEMDLNKV